ncbi:MAG TPA: OmpA family protein, partial [Candidatus Limnocylindrales bacterium]|nr:OmpA family protein [Candidatus Limnocylindrales bacterium]
MKTETMGTAVVLLTAFALAGCSATLPPNELVTARSTYARAAQGPAASVAPADLDTAKKSLDLAENSFKDDGDTYVTKDLAYAAARSAELAETRARTTLAMKAKDQTNASAHANEKNQAQLTAAELANTKGQLASQSQALATETERRQEAERRAAQAAADLAKFASVKQDPVRGMVITLSGGVLFESAKWQLLPSAQGKLNEVADALTKQDVSSTMVVEGHTDSQGKDAANQELSQKRADAVRTYL